MSRNNNKTTLVTEKNSIMKSNDFSVAKLNQGLSLKQMQLLVFAILSTQKDGKTKFNKHEFQDQFEISKYNTANARKDVEKLFDLSFSTVDLENDYFDYLRVFQRMIYKNGVFSFKWTDDMIPHILELKQYNLTDLTLTSQFKSGFSWVLYDYLKGHYGNWFKEISKEALMRLFNVEDRVTYQRSTALFKTSVLDVAIKEINDYTELEVWYTEKRVGNKIVGFVLHWSTGKRKTIATDKQIKLLTEISEEVEKNMLEYLSVKNIEAARTYIIKIKKINLYLKNGMSVPEADKLIKESLEYYRMLEHLLENDGTKRDTSIYFNWLEEIE